MDPINLLQQNRAKITIHRTNLDSHILSTIALQLGSIQYIESDSSSATFIVDLKGDAGTFPRIDQNNSRSKNDTQTLFNKYGPNFEIQMFDQQTQTHTQTMDRSIPTNIAANYTNTNTHMQITPETSNNLQNTTKNDLQNTTDNIDSLTLDPSIIDETHHIDNTALMRGMLELGLSYNSEAFLNLTELEIPLYVQYLVSMGPKFCLPIFNEDRDHKKLLEAINNFSHMYGNIYQGAYIREMAKEHLHNHKNLHKKMDPKKTYIKKAYIQTIQFFKGNHNIIIIEADKANISILMYTSEYINKCESHLSDIHTYQKISQSSSVGLQKRNETLLTKLAGLNFISQYKIRHILAEETQISKFRGLVKTHKPNSPIRPIINTRSSPGYSINKIITEIISKIQEHHKYNVKNSGELKNILNLLAPAANEFFYTLDVNNMYTNITSDMIVAAIHKRWNKIAEYINPHLLIELIFFANFFSSEFSFNNQLFKQIKGLRMGAGDAGHLADLVMEDILDVTVHKLKMTNSEIPILITKYIDDILICSTEETAGKFHTILNSVYPNINTSLDREDNNNTINYLDITIYNHHNYTISTNWFSKPYASGRILNYNSSHATQVIYNTAREFTNRVLQLSDSKYRNQNILKIRDILKKNAFPEHVIQSIFAQTKCGKSRTSRPASFAKIAIPTVPHLTQSMKMSIGEILPNITIPETPINVFRSSLKKTLKRNRNGATNIN